ncbi:iron chaperone [Nonomuraea typhae]|uniref:Iron chaperone n=1 Tax=Nonomuraea typhae TaxID=2603600 RepID=A0ABW7Z996_9ACTN
MTATQTAAQTAAGTKFDGFSDEERAAMKEHAKDLKKASRRGTGEADVERDVLDKIAEMGEADRVVAERVHAIVRAAAPGLAPKLWYGMPAYTKDGKIVCFFQPAAKFKARYPTLGFNDVANLDDGAVWATAFAINELTPAGEAKIAELVKQAVS